MFLQRTLNAYDIYKIHPCSITSELVGFIYFYFKYRKCFQSKLKADSFTILWYKERCVILLIKIAGICYCV